jgi:hypothetical protein
MTENADTHSSDDKTRRRRRATRMQTRFANRPQSEPPTVDLSKSRLGSSVVEPFFSIAHGPTPTP